MPSSLDECPPSFFSSRAPSRLSARISRDETSREISPSRLASFASLATATASDKSPACFHTSAAASCGAPASTKNAEANKYLCLESSAYAFFKAASRFFRKEKSREKKSASRVSRAARNTPASVFARPSAAKRSAHGFSPPGSRVFANASRAAASVSRRSVSSSRTHSGAPVIRSARHDVSFESGSGPSATRDPSDDKPNDARSASCASLCVAHASSSPRGPCWSRRRFAVEPSELSPSRERLRASLRARARRSVLKRRPASSTAAASSSPSASRSASSVANKPTRSAPVSPGRLRAAPRDATSDAASSASEAENRADASFSSAFPKRPPTRETDIEVASSTAEFCSSRAEDRESRFKSMPNPKRAGAGAGAGAPPNPANPPNAPASNSGTRLGVDLCLWAIFACAFSSRPSGEIASPETTSTRSSRSCATDAAAPATENGPPSEFHEFEFESPSPPRRRSTTRLAAARARRVSPRTSQSMSTRGWYSGSAVAASSMRTFSEAPELSASVTSSWSTPTTKESPNALHANPPTESTSPPREGPSSRGSASPFVSRESLERFAWARTGHCSRRATRTSTRAPRAMASASAPPPRSNQLRWHFPKNAAPGFLSSEPIWNSAASANAPRASLSASQTSTRPSGSASATAAPVGDDASVVDNSVFRSCPSSEDVFKRRRHPASVQRGTSLAVQASVSEASAFASLERRHVASATSPRASTRAAKKARARTLVCPAGITAGTVPGKHTASTREKASPSTRGTRGVLSFCFATSAHESTSPSRRVAASAAKGAPFVFAAAPETSCSETSYASSEAIV